MSSSVIILQYQTLSPQLYLLKDETCYLIKEGCSKRMGIHGQTPTKSLIIQFHLQLSTNKQWLEDFKILHISFTFTNIKLLFMKSILWELNIINFAILWNVWFSKIFCKIHWSNVFSHLMCLVFYQNITFLHLLLLLCFERPTYFLFSKMRIIVIFAASIPSVPLTS